MENSEVLDVDAQENQQPQQETVVENNTTNIYEGNTGSKNQNSLLASSPVVGENNHAETIANNTLANEDMKQTYNYTSQSAKNYDESLTTTTTQSTGANMSATWNPSIQMDEGYKAKDDSDYSWNKQAQEQAPIVYAQEEMQARYESIQTKQELNEAAKNAWNQYFGSEASARQTQDKMGWTGGQKTASDLQISFLQAQTASDMYTKDEMQKYGVETKLGIARLYAEAEQNTLALKYYQDAVDLAIKEGEQTGYYVPAEAKEMFQQDEMARDILKDPMATQEQKDRANGVLKATQKYYDNKGFQRGYAKDKNGKVITEYYGIKTLQLLTHEETVRNNKINEELQRQQVEAAKSQAGAAWASYRNAKREFNLRVKQTNAALVTDMFNAVAAGQATYDEKTGIVSGYQGANWKVTGKGDLKNQNAVRISG
jgi:hypothetical protein